MQITKGALDGIKNKWNGLGKTVRRVLVFLACVYAFVAMSALIFSFQYENTSDPYFLFEMVNKIAPMVSLIIYKGIVSVFVTIIIFCIFISGRKLRRKIQSGDVEFKITFDEEETARRFMRVFGRILAIVNLLISFAIGYVLFKKVFVMKEHMDMMVMFAICSGASFWVLMHLFYKIGRLAERFVVNPLKGVLAYAFYLVFTIWFVVLTSTLAPFMILGMIGSVFLFLLFIFLAYAFCKTYWEILGW